MCMAAAMAIGAVASIAQGIGQYQAAQYNAEMAKQQAIRIGQMGLIAENQERQKNDQALGQQIVDMTHAGLSPASGTPLTLAFASRRNAELDALAIRADYQMKREQALNESELYKAQGTGALIGSAFSAGGQLLSQRQVYSSLQ